ncbi:MAG TPA: ring-opening amidohydrolase [Candidatus Sulfotelmatobacter sp.]|nr:ring-opening amidohydrolase [Candidatus Sulfotelmatobacter sp.]
MQALVHRLPTAAPHDVSALHAAIDAGAIRPEAIVAVLGKTEGNGCVNDFTRGYATSALKQAIAARLGQTPETVERRVAFVMSGGTEGGLSPHWLVFEVRDAPAPPPGAPKALAIGVAFTPTLPPEAIGRQAQATATATAVREAMARARIAAPADVHYVQIKCPLLTKARIAEAESRGQTVATQDTYMSMGYSRGASALGVAQALGELGGTPPSDAAVCVDLALFSGVASASAGIEMMENQIMVLGNSAAWSGDLVIGHGVMADAIDVAAAGAALAAVGIELAAPLDETARARIAAVLCKAEPSQSGLIRGRRHIMLDDSDIHASRHARALVGGVLAGVFGDTQLFVSGGAEHQGPDGGGPLAVIARR